MASGGAQAVPPAFAANPWFASLPPDIAQTLLTQARPRRLARGEVLFQQGDVVKGTAGAFFGLASGRIKMSILDAEGGEAILTVIEPGNWFGEVPVLENLPRALSAQAVDDTELLQMDANGFLALMEEAPFAQAIARLLANRLRLVYEFVGIQALRSMRERIAARLLALARGDLTQAGQERARLSTSQEALAMMLGISRPSINKELQVLVSAGVIALRYGGIEILDAQRLTAIAAGETPTGSQLSDR